MSSLVLFAKALLVNLPVKEVCTGDSYLLSFIVKADDVSYLEGVAFLLKLFGVELPQLLAEGDILPCFREEEVEVACFAGAKVRVAILLAVGVKRSFVFKSDFGVHSVIVFCG